MTDTATTTPSTELEAFQHGDLDPATSRHLAAQWRESQRLAMTAVVPKTITHTRQNVGGQWQDVPQPPEVVKATVFAVVRYGELFGYPPAVALNKVDVIEGRLEPRYDALAGLMYEAGHQIRFRESSSETCTIAVRRAEDRDDPDGWQVITYTIEDARRAGLVKDNPTDRDKKSAWYSHPADMLVSKAMRRACRRFTPDVLIRREDADLLEGATVEQMVAPGRAVGISAGPAPQPSAPAEPDSDDEPVDAELVEDEPEPAAGEPEVDPTVDEAKIQDDRRARAQRALMATAAKAFPKDDTLPPAAARAKVTAQRHAVAYAVLGAHKSANDMTIDELVKVTAWLDDVVNGTVDVVEDAGEWTVRYGDREVVVPAEAA
jgi:hypothetical protein